LQLAVFVELRLEDFAQVEEEWWNDDEGSDEDAQERETLLADAEAVCLNKDDDEGFEPDVKETIDEGDVEVEEKDLTTLVLTLHEWKEMSSPSVL
jgi:hypothetical protein